MILSGWNLSATSRAKRRISRIGMSLPRYQRDGAASGRGDGFFAMRPFYPPAASHRQRSRPAGRADFGEVGAGGPFCVSDVEVEEMGLPWASFPQSAIMPGYGSSPDPPVL